MAKIYDASEQQYTRYYGALRGVDLTHPETEVDPSRFAYAKNVYRDYLSATGAAVETIPGFRKIAAFSDKKINGIWGYRPAGGAIYILVHAGTHLYRFLNSERDEILSDASKITTVYSALADSKSEGFTFDGRFYLLDGTDYYCYDGADGTFSPSAAAAYLPVTYINGEAYEQRNMLLSRAVNRETEIVTSTVGRSAMPVSVHIDGNDPTAIVWIAVNGGVTAGDLNKIVGFNYGYKSTHLQIDGETASGAFASCDVLRDVRIIHGAKVAADTFAGCTALKCVFIDRVTNVGAGAFAGCTALEAVYFANDNDYSAPSAGTRGQWANVARDAFSGCNNIKKLYLGNNTGGVDVAQSIIVYCTRTETEVETGETDEYDNPITETVTTNTYRSIFADADGNETLTDVYTDCDAGTFIHCIVNDDTTDIDTVSLETVFPGVAIHYNAPTPETTHAEFGMVIYDTADNVRSIRIGDSVLSDNQYRVDYHKIDGEWYVDRVFIDVSANVGGIYENSSMTVLLGAGLVALNAFVAPVDKLWYDNDVDVELNCKPSKYSTVKDFSDFADGNPDYNGTAIDAVRQCRIAAIADGRVFLTGNPALPNSLFWCGRDDTGHVCPMYFGVCNYVNDGTGGTPNVALLATADSLMVLKGDAQGEDTLYYHSGTDTGNDVVPRIYPSTRGGFGVGCASVARNFRDDPVFLSLRGLEAVGREQVNLERTLTHRSSLVDRALCAECVTDALCTEWLGYLVILCPSGNMYLADSRQRSAVGENTEYEWYRAEGIGTYPGQSEDYERLTGDIVMYKNAGGNITSHWLCDSDTVAYASVGLGDGTSSRYPLKTAVGERTFVVNGEVYNSHIYVASTGNEVYYSDSDATTEYSINVALGYDEHGNGIAYLVGASGRYSGGTLSPPTALNVVSDLLYFGTSNGDVCVFNTDKRGVAVDGVTPPDDTIHPSFYTFNGRQEDSVIVFAADDAGYPFMSKKTVRKSLVLYSKIFAASRLAVSVRTDRTDVWRTVGTYSDAEGGFDNVDFLSAALQVTDTAVFTVPEKEKKWAFKQLCVKNVGYMCPFGIYRAGYRFMITGRIKK